MILQWWGTDDCYTSPDNTNNECSDEMRGGFDWAGLAVGSFDFFAGFAFSGFSFSSSFSAAVGGGFAVSRHGSVDTRMAILTSTGPMH